MTVTQDPTRACAPAIDLPTTPMTISLLRHSLRRRLILTYGIVGALNLLAAVFGVFTLTLYQDAGRPADGIGMLLLSLLSGMALSALLVRRFSPAILRPVDRVERLAEQVASGDLTCWQEEDADDGPRPRTGRPAPTAMPLIRHRLIALIGGAQRSSHGILAATHEFVARHTDLRAHAQAWSQALSRAMAWVDRLTHASRESADGIESVRTLSAASSDLVSRGSSITNSLATDLRRIDALTVRMAGLVADIDAVTMRAHVVALNTAVEAAHSRGAESQISVLAGEMRTLTQRLGEIAHTAGGLVGEAGDGLDACTRRVEDLGTTLSDLGANHVRLGDAAVRLGNAWTVQARDIERARAALEEIDLSRRQQVAMTEAVNGVAEDIRSQAHSLAGAVGVFRI